MRRARCDSGAGESSGWIVISVIIIIIIIVIIIVIIIGIIVIIIVSRDGGGMGRWVQRKGGCWLFRDYPGHPRMVLFEAQRVVYYQLLVVVVVL